MSGTTIQNLNSDTPAVATSTSAKDTSVPDIARDKLSPSGQVNVDQTELTGATQFTKAAHKLSPVPIARLYPHVFDDAVPEGQSRTHLLSGLADARLAQDAMSESDFDELGFRLGLVANSLRSAHESAPDNIAYRSVVAFIRRAALVAQPTEVSRSALNALAVALRTLSENPLIDLEDAAELSDQLASEGWRGDHAIAKEVIAGMLEEIDPEIAKQKWLFEEQQAE
jgi:hypothetical protein